MALCLSGRLSVIEQIRLATVYLILVKSNQMTRLMEKSSKNGLEMQWTEQKNPGRVRAGIACGNKSPQEIG
jgi:hypothetical protein